MMIPPQGGMPPGGMPPEMMQQAPMQEQMPDPAQMQQAVIQRLQEIDATVAAAQAEKAELMGILQQMEGAAAPQMAMGGGAPPMPMGGLLG